jgi:hypothetical protein
LCDERRRERGRGQRGRRQQVQVQVVARAAKLANAIKGKQRAAVLMRVMVGEKEKDTGGK